MADLHITWVDILVAAILVASIFFAIYRGFVRETLSIFAWIAAAFAMLYLGHYVVPLLAPHMSMMLAEVLAYIAVFLLVLMPLVFFGSRISRRVQESPVGVLDRMLGALFGIVRGLAVIAVLYILYSLVEPVPTQAKWMKDARTLPLIQKSATVLLDLLPSENARYLQARTERTTAVAEPDEAAKVSDVHSMQHDLVHRKPFHKGYGADDRRALNRLIETSGSGGGNER